MPASMRLAPMEELIFWDDRPAFPSSCFFRVSLRGELNRLRLEEAMARTLPLYPLFYSQVRLDSAGRPHWQIPPTHRFFICWYEESGRQELPSARRIDLTTESATRFYAASNAGQSTLLIQFHHTCSDGLGIMRFVRDLLTTYADPKAIVQPAPLEHRRSPRSSPWSSTSSMLAAIWRAIFIARRRPVPLVPRKPVSPETELDENYPTAVWQNLDPAETILLSRAAARQKVTMNDLLLRDLMLTLAEWRSSGGNDGQNGWMRIMVPVLMKKASAVTSQGRDPVSLLFLDVKTDEIASPNFLFKIHQEMQVKKQGGEGHLFMQAIALARKLHGGIAKHVRANKCLFTTIFSNMGKVPIESSFQNGELANERLTLENVQAITVMRRYAPANFLAMTICGKLSLTMTFDIRVIPRSEAETILQGFLARIRDTIKLGI